MHLITRLRWNCLFSNHNLQVYLQYLAKPLPDWHRSLVDQAKKTITSWLWVQQTKRRPRLILDKVIFSLWSYTRPTPHTRSVLFFNFGQLLPDILIRIQTCAIFAFCLIRAQLHFIMLWMHSVINCELL